jgi:hypothetical protein
MALVSPGVEVSVIDESFYTPAAPGTVPMIFVATAQNKRNGSGTGTAAGTLAANAGKPYLLTSQRELAETFGDPIFYTDANNNPIHGGELNEYGLQAAYSLLGVSNRVYVTRAAIDLGKLNPSAEAPADTPANGTNWLDTQNTSFGIFEWNGNAASTTGGQSFTVQTPIVITDVSRVTGTESFPGAPKAGVGAKGQYAVVAVSNLIRVWYKNTAGTWVEVGSADWSKSWATVRTRESNPTITQTSSLVINNTNVAATGTNVASYAQNINDAAILGITAAAVDGALEIYSTGADVVISAATGNLLGELGLTAGTYKAPALQTSPHTQVPEFKALDTAPKPTGSVWVKTTEPNQGARWRVKRWNDETQLWADVAAPIYANSASALAALDRSGGGINLAAGDVYVKYNVEDEASAKATFRIFTRVNTGPTTIVGKRVTNNVTAGNKQIRIAETKAGDSSFTNLTLVTFTTTGASSDVNTVAAAINAAGFTNVVADFDAENKLIIRHNAGGDIMIEDTDGVLNEMGFAVYDPTDPTTTTNLYLTPITTDSINMWIASHWRVLSYTASDDAPTALTAAGELWYNSIVDEVDIMIHNGTTWVGYKSSNGGFANTDPNGPIVSASEPTQQSDATALVDGDLWISTASIENYPQIYRYNGLTLRWILLDKTDQTTEDGVLFADARWSTAGSNADAADIVDLLSNDYLDPDAPDPALYPKGMLLWNLRRSGFNVKRFERNYINTSLDNDRFNDGESMDSYYPHRWVTESGNQEDGSGSFGRIAQRKVVIQSLQAMVNSNQEIRDDESRIFNLMATPGYPELIGEMITLNFDRGLSAFIVGDSPARLTPDATSLNEWGQNVRRAVEDNDQGLVSFDEYMGVYYPWGFTSDNAGNNVVVPPSHMALRTIALSDQVSYPWFAPAGTRRGGVTNATASGYISSEGEFVSIALNEGQRDTLYSNAVNPITFLSGSGLVVFGQKTRARNASALDRINVARLVIYMRGQLNRLAKPYLFEPNDKITRDQIKAAAESLCLELVGQRALYDFLVVCDESNNTPSRIDRNELWLDIAIEPVKAVEFIYIPLRLKNTGEIASL